MLTPQDLAWKRHGDHWVLKAGSRKFGRVVPDATYPGMWRPVLLSGGLGDMANLSWAKSVTLDAAVREIEWDIAQRSVQALQFPAENEGVFSQPAPPIAPINEPLSRAPG